MGRASQAKIPEGNGNDSAAAYKISRWLVICVFGLASTLNYLDRQLLAAAAPTMEHRQAIRLVRGRVPVLRGVPVCGQCVE